MNGEPDARRIAPRPLDTVPLSGGDQDVIAGTKAQPRTVVVHELRLALEQDDPLGARLVEQTLPHLPQRTLPPRAES